MSSTAETTVLVTGGSGFLGSYCLIALLNAGYQVRTTVRSVSTAKTSALKDALKRGDVKDSSLERLSFFAADLTKDEGWAEAVKGCTYVLHVASPFPNQLPKHEDDLIVPAREGTLRVLKAAKAASVKRVVVTSSFAAIAFGVPTKNTPFTEEDWSDAKGPSISPYEKSKTIAERAAWDFVKSPEGQGLELSVVNPVGIMGPVLSSDFATSIILIQRLLNGDLPGSPDLSWCMVDVRDVASLEVLAMTHPAAAGERFLAAAPPIMSVRDIALTLKEKRPTISKRTPTRQLPNFVLKIVALWDGEVKYAVQHLGERRDCTNEKAKRVLGWEPRSREDAIIATADSLVSLGLVKK